MWTIQEMKEGCSAVRISVLQPDFLYEGREKTRGFILKGIRYDKG